MFNSLLKKPGMRIQNEKIHLYRQVLESKNVLLKTRVFIGYGVDAFNVGLDLYYDFDTSVDFKRFLFSFNRLFGIRSLIFLFI